MNMKKIIGMLLCFVLVTSLLAGCGQSSEAGEDAETYHTIAVAVYDPTDPEMALFIHYYQNYIAESFPVSFLISGELGSAEEEIEFLTSAKEAGAEACISFYGEDLESILEACGELELYYVKGSASISDEDYEAYKDDPWFLGVIGPFEEEEEEIGREMAALFAAEGASSYLILTGGAGGQTNFMQYTRAEAMLAQLAEDLELTYTEEIGELAAAEELTVVETGREDVTIVLAPGYLQTEEGQAALTEALALADYDAVLSVMGIGSVSDILQEVEDASEDGLLVGVVDCFSEENLTLAESGLLDYVAGKYASMAAPAFAAVFNAMEGDLDLMNPDGEAFRISQSYWTAVGQDEYDELYSYTQSIYENAYSSVDLMSVIRAYNGDATYEEFCLLAESSDIESVRERLGE